MKKLYKVKDTDLRCSQGHIKEGSHVELTEEEAKPIAQYLEEIPQAPSPQGNRPNAKDLIDKIKTMEDPDEVEALLENEDRPTVIEAINKRLAALKG